MNNDRKWAWRTCPENSTHSNYRSSLEVGREELYVDGCRHENEFQRLPFLNQPPQNTQQEVAMDMSFMYLVNDHHVILGEVRVRGELPQEEALRQEQYTSS